MGEEYRITAPGVTGYMLKMTSQQWLTDADYANNSDAKSIWWHYLVVLVPEGDNLKYTKTGGLYITGGSMGDSPPTIHSEDVFLAATLAVTSGTVVGALFQVPNEHIIFASDPIQKSRTEE
jgi:PhoPQ-activated pathogenicity-related protein